MGGRRNTGTDAAIHITGFDRAGFGRAGGDPRKGRPSADPGAAALALDLSRRLDHLGDGPFTRVHALTAGLAPAAGLRPVDLSLGEPHHAFPATVARTIADREAEWGRYPPLRGSLELRAAIVRWLGRRYRLAEGAVDPERQVLALSGSREGLFLIAQVAVADPLSRTGPPPVVLLPNPYYAAYAGAAAGAGAEPVFVPATAATGYLPDYASLAPDVLDRTALCYLCSPANPQGAAATAAYLETLIGLARAHDFVLAVDECYAELYDAEPPPGALEVCAGIGDGGCGNVVVFHSLSKRSSVPGLRSAFVCGDADVIAAFARLRAYSAATAPGPVLAASAALWDDDAHVAATRDHYRARFDQAERILGGRFGFRRPDGAFFLWLDVGDGEAATRRLWTEQALKVMPGAYLSHGIGRDNPGHGYIRVALVKDADVTEDILGRIARTL